MNNISDYIDKWCEEHYGHRNWEHFDSDNEDNYYEKHEMWGIGVMKTPHNDDGDCLCSGDVCLEEKTDVDDLPFKPYPVPNTEKEL